MAQFDFNKLFRTMPPTQRLARLNVRPDLARAAARMVSDERSDADVKQLQSELNRSESVVALIEGRHRRHLGLLALTSERVLFRRHGCAPGDIVSFPIAEIWSVEEDVGSMTSRVRLRITDSTLDVDKILGQQGREFADAVRSQVKAPGPLPERDVLAELGELRARRAAGTINEGVYRAEKARLVDEL